MSLCAELDPELDRAEHDLRQSEFRWPIVPSIALIVALSVGLWYGIFALAAHIAAKV